MVALKNRYWIMILAAILLLCFELIFLPSSDTPTDLVQIKYGSNTLSVTLTKDQEFTFAAENGGYNTVTIRDGKIAVTAADCPDGYCMERGFCDSGTPIVCLPHKLFIEFMAPQEIDGLLG